MLVGFFAAWRLFLGWRHGSWWEEVLHPHCPWHMVARTGMGTVLDLGTRVGPASRELGHPVITAGWERLFLS